VGGGMLWRSGCDEKVLRYGAGERYQQLYLYSSLQVQYRTGTSAGSAERRIRFDYFSMKYE
jgi:hypothetical protein